MIPIIVTLVVLWMIVVVAAILVWRNRRSDDLKILPIIIQSLTLGIGLTGVIISLYGLTRTMRIERDSIVPKLQVVPLSISQVAQSTTLELAVKNFSDYGAVKIYFDVKLGDSAWARELSRVVSREAFDRYTPQDLKPKRQEMFDKFLTHPDLETLPAGKGVLWFIGDPNRHFWEQMSFQERLPDGTEREIPFEETSLYKSSLGWFDALSKADPKSPLVLVIHTRWQNQKGRHFEQVMMYRIEVTRSGSMSSVAFLPDKLLFENY